jgi:hypothetical protein
MTVYVVVFVFVVTGVAVNEVVVVDSKAWSGVTDVVNGVVVLVEVVVLVVRVRVRVLEVVILSALNEIALAGTAALPGVNVTRSCQLKVKNLTTPAESIVIRRGFRPALFTTTLAHTRPLHAMVISPPAVNLVL